jgi:hypothetical protein
MHALHGGHVARTKMVFKRKNRKDEPTMVSMRLPSASKETAKRTTRRIDEALLQPMAKLLLKA